jgi:hypothetical protein
LTFRLSGADHLIRYVTSWPLLGNFQQAFYGGQSPWQYEALFVTRAKSVVQAQGVALARELAEPAWTS